MAQATGPFKIEVARTDGTRYLYNDGEEFSSVDDAAEVVDRLNSAGYPARVVETRGEQNWAERAAAVDEQTRSGVRSGGPTTPPQSTQEAILAQIVELREAVVTIKNIVVFFFVVNLVTAIAILLSAAE